MWFSQLVRKDFRYMTEEYGFTVGESLQGPEPFAALGHGKIEFRSQSTIIIIRLDRGEVTTQIGPILEPEIGWLSIIVLVEFLTKGQDTTLLDISKRAQYDWEGWVAYRVDKYAIALRKYL